jgi:predicted enzyme related to lactoylglutathione lyase
MAKHRGRSAAAISPQQPEEAAQGIPPHWNVYVTVEDVDASAGKAREAGGKVLAPPFDVFDAGRMAVVADPAGAVLCLWQAGTNIGAEVVNEPGSMTWADCATTDPAAAQGFYSSLLDWRFDQMSEEPPYWVIFNGERSQGGMTAPPPGVPSNWFPYFGVIGIEETMQIADAFGGTPFLGPVDVPNGSRFALIQDPQGAPFAIYEGDYDD